MKKVIVVDDEESIRFSFRRFLTDEGYHVETAANTIDAMALISAREFDIAIIDCFLGGDQYGIDLVKYIEEVQTFCKIILISAYPDSANVTGDKYKEFVYLVKPVKRNEICRVFGEKAERKKEKSNKILISPPVYVEM